MPKASPGERVLPEDRGACACTSIRLAARQLTELYDRALAPSGLRITQYALLANVDRSGTIAMTALATALVMDRTTLTRNVAPLARAGLLTLRSAGRGRTKLVELTASGRSRLRSAYPYWQLAQQQYAAALGAEASRNLFQLAEALSTAHHAAHALEPPGR